MDGNLLRSGKYADFILAHLNINEHPDFFNAVRFLGDEFALKTAQNQGANIRK